MRALVAADVGQQGQGHMTLDGLDRASAPLRAYIISPIEFPEPAQKLDMASRQGAPDRQFKYLHQMCLLHASNFSGSTCSQHANHDTPEAGSLSALSHSV
jgi:hypothetical protein